MSWLRSSVWLERDSLSLTMTSLNRLAQSCAPLAPRSRHVNVLLVSVWNGQFEVSLPKVGSSLFYTKLKLFTKIQLVCRIGSLSVVVLSTRVPSALHWSMKELGIDCGQPDSRRSAGHQRDLPVALHNQSNHASGLCIIRAIMGRCKTTMHEKNMRV